MIKKVACVAYVDVLACVFKGDDNLCECNNKIYRDGLEICPWIQKERRINIADRRKMEENNG